MSFRRKPAVVSRFVRKLPGGSQPALIEADDGELYVLKFLNNIQGPQLLFNESIGTELYRLAKLPAPRWRRLIITPAFIDRNRLSCMNTAQGTWEPLSGMCFGSMFLGSMHRQIYELLPGTFYKRLTNIDDFWLAWLLDVCANHADNRQALFPVGLRGTFYAVFIDHGHMFGGPHAEMHPHAATSRYLDPRLYSLADIERVTRLKEVLVNLPVEKLWLEAQHLPEEWKSASALHRLSESLSSLATPTIIEHMLDELLDLHRRTEDSYRSRGTFSRKTPLSIVNPGLEPSRLGRFHLA